MKESINKQPIGGYFVIVPEWLLALPISASAVRVYCVLRRHADNKTGECYPTRRTIAEKAQMSIATVDRAVRELVANGAISMRKRRSTSGDWTSNIYTMNVLPFVSPREVAAELIPPALISLATGSSKSVAQTKPILDYKQEQPKYTAEERQHMSIGAALFHTGASLQEVQESAIDTQGEIRTVILETYLQLCERHGIATEGGKS